MAPIDEMREIKFRAWDNKSKEWLLGYEMPNLGGFSLFGELVLMGEWANILNEYLFDRNGHKAEDLIVMQFTGLKDKNNKEIYEGDILKSAPKGHEPRTLYQIIWDEENLRWTMKEPDGALFYGCNTDDNKFFVWEIIGNIYENPELLK